MAVSEFNPTISVLIPTLNSERVIQRCLKSLANQTYPKKKIEIIMADGGSSDKTIMIARRFGVKIVKNRLRTGEAGKAEALRHAKGDLIALIDSDNFLPSKDWLARLIEPFKDKEIIGSEPWEFLYRRSDGIINRYCSLLGMNDPYCYFVGNYDKRSFLSGKWTGLNLPQEDMGNYLKVKIEGGVLPTIGANGTLWRAKVLKGAVADSDYLFDTDIPYFLLKSGPYKFAKVKVAIYHDFCKSFMSFYRKQRRRAKDFFFLEKASARSSTYQKQFSKQLYFIISTLLIWPLVLQSLWGYIKKPDIAWFIHPFACIVTLWLYGKETIASKFRVSEENRKNWKQ